MISDPLPLRRALVAVALVSATLLMTELALTRIFFVVMYYHFAFLAISIALFGLSASGVFAYVARRWLDRYETGTLLSKLAILYSVCTIVALFALVRLRVGLNYSPRNLVLMLTIYALAALPFFSGGLVLTLAISRLAARINAVYAADLTGASLGCLILIPLLDRLGAPGAATGDVGVGHQRGALGRWGHARHFHRDELGVPRDPGLRVCHLSARLCRAPHRQSGPVVSYVVPGFSRTGHARPKVRLKADSTYDTSVKPIISSC